MNILMLGWELPPHNSGGLGVACYHLSKALAEYGANIDFMLPYTADHSDIDFMKIHSVTPLSPLERNGLGAYDSNSVAYKTLAKDSIEDLKAIDSEFIEGKKYILFKNLGICIGGMTGKKFLKASY